MNLGWPSIKEIKYLGVKNGLQMLVCIINFQSIITPFSTYRRCLVWDNQSKMKDNMDRDDKITI